LQETEGQLARLERIFEILDVKPEKETCDAMKGLVTEGDEIIKNVKEGPLRDAALVAAAQKVEHYEIASYGTLCEIAKGLGQKEVKQLLAETLEEEKMTDEKLTELAQGGINEGALNAEAA
jgi:ferritin-like metal-binding protein YciE